MTESAVAQKEILPSHIDPSQPFQGAFGKIEAEDAARVIVSLCQHQGDRWYSFTLRDLKRHWRRVFPRAREGAAEWGLTYLIDANYDRRNGLGIMGPMTEPSPNILTIMADRYQVRPAFIEACFKASPANR